MSKKNGSLKTMTTEGFMLADWIDGDLEFTINRGESIVVGPFIFTEDSEIDELAEFLKEKLEECCQ